MSNTAYLTVGEFKRFIEEKKIDDNCIIAVSHKDYRDDMSDDNGFYYNKNPIIIDVLSDKVEYSFGEGIKRKLILTIWRTGNERF